MAQLELNESADLDADFRGAIVAMTADRVIGVDGTMPWHYSADMKRFRRLTTGTTVIMGRLTFEAMGSKPLKDRRNIVISSTRQVGVETYSNIELALADCQGPVWFIGGSMIYAAAMDYCQLVDVVYVPDRIDPKGAVLFPEFDPCDWRQSEVIPFAEDPRLRRCQFMRIKNDGATRLQDKNPRGENMKIQVNGHEINVEISGKDDGAVVMMAHSLGCSLNMWDPQMALLEPTFKCVRLDMRGHGSSDAPVGPYTLDALADDVIAVMDHLQVDRAHWVGLSIGGMIGQSLLLRHSSRFISAALCDTMSALPEGSLDIWEQRVATVERDGLASISDATMERWFTPPFIAENSEGFQSVRAQFARRDRRRLLGLLSRHHGP